MTERRCAHCKRTKPETIDHFYLMRSGRWDTWCKECKKEYNRQERAKRKHAEFKLRSGQSLTAQEIRAARAAERQRETQRNYMRRQRAKAEYAANHAKRAKEYREKNGDFVRERARINHRIRVGGVRLAAPAKGRQYYKRALSKPEEYLPVEPFAGWIEDTFGRMARIEAPTHLGLPERTIDKVLCRDQSTVTLRVVDRAFVTFGRPDLLNALYPMEISA